MNDGINACLIAAVSLCGSISANSVAETYVGLAAGVSHFEYTEYNDRGLQLDQDSGQLVNAALDLQFTKNRYAFGLLYNAEQGDLDYRSLVGRSTSRERIKTLELNASTQFYTLNRFTVRSGIFFGQRQWSRYIFSTDQFYGLDEDYTSTYAGLSLEAIYKINAAHQVAWIINAGRFIHGDIAVRFLSGDYDRVRIPLNDGARKGLGVSWRYEFSPSYYLTNRVTFTDWDIDASAQRNLQVAGAVTSSLVGEPRSEASHLSYLIGIAKVF